MSIRTTMTHSRALMITGLCVWGLSACYAVEKVFPGKKSKGAIAETNAASHGLITYYEHIAPIMSEKCLPCHGQSSAVFSLADFQAVRSQADRVVQSVLTKRMPQWLAAPGIQEYQDDPSLTAAQLDLFLQWKKGGYQAGELQPSPSGEAPGKKMQFEPTLTLPALGANESYEPVYKPHDEYRCFLIPLPKEWNAEKKTQYIDAVTLQPGNLDIVHHLTLFMVTKDIAQALKVVDEMDPRPGYGCNGDSLPEKLADASVAGRLEREKSGIIQRFPKESAWIYHWTPGMQGSTFPEGTGIRTEPDSMFVMQYHFHSQSHGPEGGLHGNQSERGGKISLRFADQVAKPGFFHMVSNDLWYNARSNGSLVIPPNGYQTVETLLPIKSLVQVISHKTGIENPALVEIHSANLHMHTRGLRAATWLEKLSRPKEVMLDIPAYNYSGQRNYFFKNPKTILDAEFDTSSIGVSCTYYNPGGESVYGGLFSEDEMCVNFFFVSATARKN